MTTVEKAPDLRQNLRETKTVENLTPERMGKVVAPLHFMDLWLVGSKDWR